jgi:putative transcriptional regulator|nr:MAG TPA_asm: Cro/C1-type HTH DNA-binding domain protein [Caudoviricetes sp.]
MEVKFLIVYDKLGDYLKSKNMKYIDLQRELSLSPSMTAKFTKNRIMSTDTLNKVCEYLHVQPSEIMEWIPDAEYNKTNEEKQAIEAQIAELQAKLKQM